MAIFRQKRARDINLEIAISSHTGTLPLYVFDEPALNSVSADLSAERDAGPVYRIVDRVEVATKPLRDVLDEHLPRGLSTFDLMTIDVEGHDFEVLQSNDWSRYRPRVLVVEVINTSVEDLLSTEEVRFMQDMGYVVHSKLFGSVILLDAQSGDDI